MIYFPTSYMADSYPKLSNETLIFKSKTRLQPVIERGFSLLMMLETTSCIQIKLNKLKAHRMRYRKSSFTRKLCNIGIVHTKIFREVAHPFAMHVYKLNRPD